MPHDHQPAAKPPARFIYVDDEVYAALKDHRDTLTHTLGREVSFSEAIDDLLATSPDDPGAATHTPRQNPNGTIRRRPGARGNRRRDQGRGDGHPPAP